MSHKSNSCSGKTLSGNWIDDIVGKDKQRPPVYNPEDYVLSLKQWGKKHQQQGQAALYSQLIQNSKRNIDGKKSNTLQIQGTKSKMTPNEQGEEMRLRHFETPTELLSKLRADLRMSFPSFVQEFTCEPLDGVVLLLELLRSIQLSLTGESSVTIMTTGAPTKLPQAVRKTAMLDELACLQCISCCCVRFPDAVRRLVAGSCGLYTLTVCIMSTVNKSRIIALKLLTEACRQPANGHTTISEALSTLRLRYGEPVRFRFLVGMIQSSMSTQLQVSGLAFINALLASAPTPQKKLYIQAELEQAGFDVLSFKKGLAEPSRNIEAVSKEIELYEMQLIDIDTLNERANKALKEKDDLISKLELLEKRVKILQEEKGVLKSLEQCLKEKCCDLQEEVSSLKLENGIPNNIKQFYIKKIPNRGESSPPEDEGISSSERSISPTNEHQREPLIFKTINFTKDSLNLLSVNHMRVGLNPSNESNNHEEEDKKQPKNENSKKCREFEQAKNNFSDDKIAKTIKYFKKESSKSSLEICEGRNNVHQNTNNIVKDLKSESNGKKCSSDRMIEERETVEKENSMINYRDYLERDEKEEKLNHIVENGHSERYISNDIDNDVIEAVEISENTNCLASVKHVDLSDSKDILNDSLKNDHEKEIVPIKLLPQPPRKSKSLMHFFMQSSREGIHDHTYYSSEESESLLSDALMHNYDEGLMNSYEHNTECAIMNKFDVEFPSKAGLRKISSGIHSEVSFTAKDQIDSLFYTDPNAKQNGDQTKITHVNSVRKKAKVTKSLDRADQGTNSMIDIVVSSDDLSQEFSSSLSKSTAGIENRLIPVTHNHVFQNFQRSNSHSNVNTHDPLVSFGKPSKMFGCPEDNQSHISHNTFLMRRRSHNLGFHTGQLIRDAPTSMTNLILSGHSGHSEKKRTFTGTTKFSDMPSGLY